METTQLLTLRRATLHAGDAIMAIFHRDDVNVEHKADASPVTEADLAANAILVEAITKAFPDDLIVTEEAATSHTKTAQRFFIVDPLDGTKEFIKKGTDFTVNIGLIEDGVPVFGMVYAPALGRLFYTLGDGAVEESAEKFNTDNFGMQKPIGVAVADNNALRVVASKSHRDAATDNYISKYAVADFVSAGSSLKFCLVAAGEADLYPRLGPTMEWDTAAADAITRAAGGEVLDFETKQPFQYGKADYRNGFFIVRSPNVELA